jgi:hypothetical protein
MGARKQPDGPKTESLSLRIDEKLDFAVWFATRALDKTKQAFAEGAIRKAADDAHDEQQRNWRKFWDVSRGVRDLSLLRWGAFETTVEEDRRREFVQAHAMFFFEDEEQKVISRTMVDVLWPDIEEYEREWFDTRRKDYWGVWTKMADRVEAAGLRAPVFTNKDKDVEF